MSDVLRDHLTASDDARYELERVSKEAAAAVDAAQDRVALARKQGERLGRQLERLVAEGKAIMADPGTGEHDRASAASLLSMDEAALRGLDGILEKLSRTEAGLAELRSR